MTAADTGPIALFVGILALIAGALIYIMDGRAWVFYWLAMLKEKLVSHDPDDDADHRMDSQRLGLYAKAEEAKSCKVRAGSYWEAK